MRTARILSLLAAPALSLSLAACGGPVDEPMNQFEDDVTREAQGVPQCRLFPGSTAPQQISQDQMQRLYAINPTPHAEQSYQVPPDTSPPTSAYQTIADYTGCIVVLDTFLYNRETVAMPRGTPSAYAIHSPRDYTMCQDSGPLPYRQTICGLITGRSYYIQPLTPNTQAKLLQKSAVP